MADEQTEGTEKKSSPMKIVIIVAALMVVEAVVVFALVAFSGIGTSGAEATTIEGQEENERERLVELQLVEADYTNTTTGQTWIWQVQLFLQVRNKNKEHIEQELERRQAEIISGLRTIFSRAQHRHLREPGSETMTRQLDTFVDGIFGADAEGNPRIERILITKLAGFPGEG